MFLYLYKTSHECFFCLLIDVLAASLDRILAGDNELSRADALRPALVLRDKGVSICPDLDEPSKELDSIGIEVIQEGHFFVLVAVPPLVASLSITVWIGGGDGMCLTAA